MQEQVRVLTSTIASNKSAYDEFIKDPEGFAEKNEVSLSSQQLQSLRLLSFDDLDEARRRSADSATVEDRLSITVLTYSSGEGGDL